MPQHPYLKHLSADIRAAHRSESDQKAGLKQGLQDVPSSTEALFEEVERYVANGNDPSQPPLAAHCGLHLEEFPPAHQLSEADMEAIIEAIYDMAWTYHHTAHLPAQMPVALRYELVLEWLSEPTFIPNVGTANMDFCTGYEGVQVGVWCGCLGRWKEDTRE